MKFGSLDKADLDPWRQVLINAQPDRYRAPNSPANGWFNPTDPEKIALVVPFFLSVPLCLYETDCYAIVPKATAEMGVWTGGNSISSRSRIRPRNSRSTWGGM